MYFCGVTRKIYFTFFPHQYNPKFMYNPNEQDCGCVGDFQFHEYEHFKRLVLIPLNSSIISVLLNLELENMHLFKIINHAASMSGFLWFLIYWKVMRYSGYACVSLKMTYIDGLFSSSVAESYRMWPVLCGRNRIWLEPFIECPTSTLHW